MKRTWERWGPQVRHDQREHAIAAFGALAAIAVLLGLDYELTGTFSASMPLVAPMGASAVILFCMPQSPVGHPWNVIVGNTLSALVGVACARLLGDMAIAAIIAVAVAILVMALAHAIHPPGGAVALTAVLGGPSIKSLGFSFAADPVLLSSAVLLAISFGYRRAIAKFFKH